MPGAGKQGPWGPEEPGQARSKSQNQAQIEVELDIMQVSMALSDKLLGRQTGLEGVNPHAWPASGVARWGSRPEQGRYGPQAQFAVLEKKIPA